MPSLLCVSPRPLIAYRKVAAEFEVSPVLVATQLASHKLISPADIELSGYASG